MSTLYSDTLQKIQTLIRSCSMGNAAIAQECGVDVRIVDPIACGSTSKAIPRPVIEPAAAEQELSPRPVRKFKVQNLSRGSGPKYLPSEAEIALECERIRARRLTDMV